jgi:hypothetical protein
VVFADADAGLWGVGREGAGALLGYGALAHGSRQRGASVSFESTDSEGGEWRIAGEGSELTVIPAGEPVPTAAIEGFAQLCEVHGTVQVEGAERELNALGVRDLASRPDERHAATVRDVCAWFGPDDGFALTAVRPPDSPGHDRDDIVAAVFDPDGPQPVAEPRLSTTYGADGLPARVGLELWLEADDDGASFPRRANAEGVGAIIDLTAPGLELQAYAMRWHSHGRDGLGAYLLCRPA